MSTNVETRSFTVAPSIITHLIKSQAGSLAKAVLEAVMNSIDAGSTRIDITLEREKLSVVDDGEGLRTREAILATFEVFGFDHTTHHREHGRFGLGRAQLWNWLRTRWRTAGFQLDVDVRERGLNYTLAGDLPFVRGMTIEGDFYEPLSFVELNTTESELRRMCRYAPVPVFLNGVRISEDATAMKWTETTERFLLKVSDAARLTIYNQGILVGEVFRGTAGVGGVLVTRRGVNLTLNTARNEVLTAHCPIWAEAKKLLERHAKQIADGSARKRLTNEDRDYLAAQSADPAHARHLVNHALLTMANGRHVTIKTLCWSRLPLTVAELGNPVVEAMVRDGKVLAFAPATLERFRAASVHELLETLRARIVPIEHELPGFMEAGARIFEDITQVPGYGAYRSSRIPEAALSDAQRAVWRGLQAMVHPIRNMVFHLTERYPPAREIALARSSAQAFTDGSTFVAFEADHALACARKGLAGWMKLAGILLHEFLHDDDTAGSHQHDHDFFESFHDAMLGSPEEFHSAVVKGFETHLQHQTRITQRAARGRDLVQRGMTATG